MAQRRRQDAPGAWHHVYSRGMARRTVFESRRDIRHFLCRLALEVRRGTLELHAYCFLTTHVHLLVRSPKGELSRALRRVIHGYVRWFNRIRRRDGSLFRGRFGSRRVWDALDRLNVVAYIDANPVQARLTTTPEAYPHGSAVAWARGRAPIWLSVLGIGELLGCEGPGGAGAWKAYRRVIGVRASARNARLVEARFARRDAEPERLDDLVAAAPERVHAWMVRKAALADQTRPGLPVVDPKTVEEAWERSRHSLEGEAPARRGPARPLVRLARVALLRDLAALTYTQIATRLGSSTTEARRDYQRHAEHLRADPTYGKAVTTVARTALDSLHGPRTLRRR